MPIEERSNEIAKWRRSENSFLGTVVAIVVGRPSPTVAVAPPRIGSRIRWRQPVRPMPRLARLYIKTSLVFLVVGLAAGGYIIVAEFVLGEYPSRLLITAHVHLLLVGFMLMMVMGVATWMFPRPASQDGRYHPALATTVYWVLTIATALRAGAEILGGFSASSGLCIAIPG